jgi:hypothetical protein
MKYSDSLAEFFDSSMAGKIAPSRLPKCGRPVLWIPVRMRDMETKVYTSFGPFKPCLNKAKDAKGGARMNQKNELVLSACTNLVS